MLLGKLGAALGAFIFPYFAKNTAMLVSAGFALIGVIYTIFTCPLYNIKDLEEVSKGHFIPG